MKRETMKKVAKSFPHGWDVGSSNERERMEGRGCSLRASAFNSVRAVCNPARHSLAHWNGESCMAAAIPVKSLSFESASLSARSQAVFDRP